MLIFSWTSIFIEGQLTYKDFFISLPIATRFKEWSERYGPVFSLKVGKGTIIVLNSKRAVHDLIDKRSAIYSARPQDDQFHNTMRNENIANMDATPVWRAQRKVTTRFFAPNKLDGALLSISEAE
jgi:cytochrome P450